MCGKYFKLFQTKKRGQLLKINIAITLLIIFIETFFFLSQIIYVETTSKCFQNVGCKPPTQNNMFVCSYLASTLPHVLHISVGDVWVGRGQRVIKLLGGVNSEKEHQGLMGQCLEGTKEQQRHMSHQQVCSLKRKVGFRDPETTHSFIKALPCVSQNNQQVRA